MQLTVFGSRGENGVNAVGNVGMDNNIVVESNSLRSMEELAVKDQALSHETATLLNAQVSP